MEIVMKNAHPKYMCFPSVACVGKETEVSIFPRDISRVFREEREYELAVVGLEEDQEEYYSHIPLDHPCFVRDGCLHFTFRFEREQEYSIRFREKGTSEIRISLYAVEEDLYALRPLKGDLHAHSYYSDGQDGLAMTPSDYREEGFDFFALTDHNRMYPSRLAAELYENIPLGIHMMPGEEVHTPGSMLHIVHVGGFRSVCSQYIGQPEAYEAAVDEIAETLPHIPEQYRRRIAMATWACREIHKAGGLAIFAHPRWCPNRYNITAEFRDLLFGERIFDAFEVMGGIDCRQNNMQLVLWQEQAVKGNAIPVVGSSDSHNHDSGAEYFANRFTLVFAKENNTEAILEAIRSGYSVAGERPCGNRDEVHFFSTGSRLIPFAHFLFRNYFRETERLCAGEGILMRRYAEGEPVEDILAAQKDTVANFYRKFYGLAPAPVITPERRRFLDQCLDLQRTVGPVTKGSSLVISYKNERNE